LVIGNWIKKLLDAIQLPITHYPLPITSVIGCN
jgi:hypothetical protein